MTSTFRIFLTQFRADRTHNLIVRLRHSVIRAGLRRISLAYSRISLADVVSHEPLIVQPASWPVELLTDWLNMPAECAWDYSPLPSAAAV